MANPVNWFQIGGSDGKALEAFYKKAFGWKTSPAPDGSMAMIAPEPGGIAGGVGATQDGSPKSVTVYVGVDDIDKHLGKIEKAGGQRAMDKMELPSGMGWISGFIDPAGNWIGLWQAGKPAPAPKKAAEKVAKKAQAKKPAAKPVAAPAKKKASKKRRAAKA